MTPDPGALTYAAATPVTVGELTFDVRMLGPEGGEPVVLLHGFPENSLSWSVVAPLLADAGLRVIAPDQRGYSRGARPEGVESYTTDLLAADVAGIADALGLGTFHLVGHDWGAAVGWVVSANHSERLRTYTAVSVPHLTAFGEGLSNDPDQQARASYIGLLRMTGKAEEVLLADGARRLIAMYEGRVPEAQAEAFVALLSEPGALTAALNWYRAMRSDLSTLATSTVPTTYVWSNEDLAIARASAERCGEFVDADFRYVELDGVSHWIPEEAPEALAEIILDRVRTAPS